MKKKPNSTSLPESQPDEGPAAIPFPKLLSALLDVDAPLHPRYLYRLSDLEHDELLELKEIWYGIPAWRRQSLMEDIELLGQTNVLLSFKALGEVGIADSEPEVRRPAARALQEFEDEDLIPSYLRLLEHDGDDEVRSIAAAALGKFIYLGELDEISNDSLRRVEDHLLQAARNQEDTIVRRRAIESLGFSSREEVPGLIETAFASAKRDWKATALVAMGRSADARWSRHVLTMIGNDSASLRLEAVRAAGELEISEALPYLLDLLDDPDDDVRLASIWSLSQIGGESVRPALEHLYEVTEDEEEAEYIEEALENLAFTEDNAIDFMFDFPQGQDLDEEGLGDLLDLEDEVLDSLDEDDEDLSD